MESLKRVNRVFTARLPVKIVKNKADRPLASISFDDFPKSAANLGAKIMSDNGLLATYYAVGSFCGQVIEGIQQYDIADAQALVAAGHEIASHSFSHRAVYDFSNEEIWEEEQKNREFFRKHLNGYELSGFAYPYGEISPRTKFAYSELYPSSRGITDGVNGKLFDMAQLKAVGIESKSWTEDRIEHYIKQAKDSNAWVVFFTHDISENPSPYGCTPKMLEHAIATLKKYEIETMPVKAALSATQFVDK